MKIKWPSAVPSLILCSLLWSTGGMLIKLVSWNAMAIAGMRSLIGAITICVAVCRFPVFVVRTGETVNKRATLYKWGGAVCYSLTMILFVVATKLTTAAVVVLLQYTSPVYVILLSPLLLKEKNTKTDYLTVIGVMGGMFLFFSENLSGANLLGNVLALISGITDGLMVIFMKKQVGEHPEDSFTIAHILTFVVSVPFILTGGVPSLLSVTGLLVLGIFQIGLPSVFYSIGIVGVRALSAVFITMIEPLMNPIWVLLTIHEVPSVRTVIGGVIIMGCIGARAVILTHSHRNRTYIR